MESFGNAECRVQSAELWGAKLRILSDSVSSDRCSATAYLYCSSGLRNTENAVPEREGGPLAVEGARFALTLLYAFYQQELYRYTNKNFVIKTS